MLRASILDGFSNGLASGLGSIMSHCPVVHVLSILLDASEGLGSRRCRKLIVTNMSNIISVGSICDM